MVQLGHALFFEPMTSTLESLYEVMLESDGSFCTKLRYKVIFKEHRFDVPIIKT